VKHKKDSKYKPYRTGEKSLSKREFDKLLDVIDTLEDELLIMLAVTTGIRREDLCNIKNNNIDLDNMTLTFHETKKNTDRTIYLSPEIVLLIKKFMKTQPNRENLFSFTGRTAYRHLNRWCRVAGIPERPFHALRATCVKFCQAAGWKPEEVAKLTGDTIRVIQEHYAVPSDSEMKDTVTKKPII
jgi:integrase